MEVDNDDDDFVDLSSPSSPSEDQANHHTRVAEEREMARLDTEWI